MSSRRIDNTDLPSQLTVNGDIIADEDVETRSVNLTPVIYNPEPYLNTIWLSNSDGLMYNGDKIMRGSQSLSANMVPYIGAGGELNGGDGLTWDELNSRLVANQTVLASEDITAPLYKVQTHVGPLPYLGDYSSADGLNLFNATDQAAAWTMGIGFEFSNFGPNVTNPLNAGVYTRANPSGGGYNVLTAESVDFGSTLIGYNSYYNNSDKLVTFVDGNAVNLYKAAHGSLVIKNADSNSLAGDELRDKVTIENDALRVFTVGGNSTHSVFSKNTTFNPSTGEIEALAAGSGFSHNIEFNSDGTMRLQTGDGGLQNVLKLYPSGTIKAANLSRTSSTSTGSKHMAVIADDYSGTIMAADRLSSSSSAGGKLPVYINTTTGILYQYSSALKYKLITEENPEIDSSFIESLQLRRWDDIMTTPIETTLGLVADELYELNPECVTTGNYYSDKDPTGPDYTDFDENGEPVPHGPPIDLTYDNGVYSWREIEGINYITLNYMLLDYIQNMNREQTTLQHNFEILQQDYAALLSRIEALENAP